MIETVKLTVWRDSVCMADDVEAPHELVLTMGNAAVWNVVVRLMDARYLPLIHGGKAVWILSTESRGGRPLVMMAQQWVFEPKFLVDPRSRLASYIENGREPRLHLQYWLQRDPDEVLKALQTGEGLQDDFGHLRFAAAPGVAGQIGLSDKISP